MSVPGECVSISWILPIGYSGAVSYTGVSDDGMEELVSALNCIGGCRIVVNQEWVLISVLIFFIPSLIMVILYGKIFIVAKQQALKIENTGSKAESESYKSRVAKRETKAAKTLGHSSSIYDFMVTIYS